jgi:outer membrane protein assembly factor BamA
VEFSTAATRLGYGTEIQTYSFNGLSSRSGPSLPTAYYGSGSVAYVGDNSYSAFTNPIEGSRYRFELAPTFGGFNYTTALADYRNYLFMRPITFAVRGVHYGRYGKDSDDPRQYPLFLGEETLLRGYGYGSFDFNTECVQSRVPGQTTGCPVADRLFGSRLAVVSAELRIPLFGVPEYGLFNVPFLPLTVSPFIEAGEAWSGLGGEFEQARLSFGTENLNRRGIVASAGVSARFNVLGYVILEAYAAHPFQRPGKPWVYGFQLAPGW